MAALGGKSGVLGIYGCERCTKVIVISSLVVNVLQDGDKKSIDSSTSTTEYQQLRCDNEL